MKHCPSCKMTLDSSEFSKNKSRYDGLQGMCRKCSKQLKDKKDYRYPNYTKAYDLSRRYGITLSEYDAMFTKQNGCCAICNKPESQSFDGVVYRLAVDHNHATGTIRALLCSRCNTTIGKVEEDIDLLANMITYLNKHGL
jgi:hypothetical protein